MAWWNHSISLVYVLRARLAQVWKSTDGFHTPASVAVFLFDFDWQKNDIDFINRPCFGWRLT